MFVFVFIFVQAPQQPQIPAIVKEQPRPVPAVRRESRPDCDCDCGKDPLVRALEEQNKEWEKYWAEQDRAKNREGHNFQFEPPL